MIRSIPILLILAGCAGSPTTTAGPPPDIRPVLQAQKPRLWKDPDSVRDVSVTMPWRFMGLGWKACVRANAKNSFGGYTGLRTSTILIYDNGAPPLMQEPVIYDGCEGKYYEPMPEMEAGYRPPQAPPKR